MWPFLGGRSIKSNENFKSLYYDIKRHHLLCDIEECSHFIKNNRNREAIKECAEEKNEYDHFNDDIDLNDQFLMDLLDDIHVHLVHSFDTGFRMRNFTNFRLQTNDKREDGLYFDEDMEQFAEYFESKRKAMEKIRGIEQMAKNRYFSRVHSLENFIIS